MKPGLISYQAALGIIQQQSRLLLTEALPLAKARGHFLAEEFKAPFPLPRFINAGLDGFALVASHTHAASTTNPISIPVVGSIAAGHIVSHAPLRTPAAFEINTGAPLPT
ncbi:MAG TPA: molybdopterin molybdenumtransferase MoeA, partial [Alphaproteobacteria bacterium]|nr:molybdopterin molybdenumtransferase MoeA [Alphaproteobacteria bacterium]